MAITRRIAITKKFKIKYNTHKISNFQSIKSVFLEVQLFSVNSNTTLTSWVYRERFRSVTFRDLGSNAMT